MSVQFGKWNFDGRPAAPEFIEKVSATLAPYAPDSDERYSKDGVTILYRAFHTTKESRLEVQPCISPSGAVITWDGRLDNRKDLISELRSFLTADSTDIVIVAAAYERWGERCFGKLMGDWAISIWRPSNRSLLLAKDPIGARFLYYWADTNQITWGTVLDPIVRFAGNTFDLNEEFVAGWYSTYPAPHLTPCTDVHSVPPSCWVLLRPGRRVARRYWDFDPEENIRYRTDAEYQEHFRHVFAKAVERKLRSDRPVLAELSGGRDSSSIVCVADMLIARGEGECERLDTVSAYDDSEPNWNERPYFTKVEEKRGRTGWHMNFGPRQPKAQEADSSTSPSQFSSTNSLAPTLGYDGRFVVTPGYDGRTSADFRECLVTQGNRVVLSGIGGDEFMGGVPTPVPELQDLLATLSFAELAHQLKVWALQMKKPWFQLFWHTGRDFLPFTLLGTPRDSRPPAWLQSGFVKRNRAALLGYPARTKFRGPLPSFQANIASVEHLSKQLSCAAQPFEPPFEKRYPFLDRNLLEFIFAIPRQQLVRPTQRRSLQRRALAGIVPDEILNRKTKAFVSRRIAMQVMNDCSLPIFSSSLGIVDLDRYVETLQKVRSGKEDPLIPLKRTMNIEGWLKDMVALGCIKVRAHPKPRVALQEPVQA